MREGVPQIPPEIPLTAAAQMLLAKMYLNAGVYTGTTNYAGVLTALVGAPVFLWLFATGRRAWR